MRLNPGQTQKFSKTFILRYHLTQRLNRHPTLLTLQHTGKKFNLRVGHFTPQTVGTVFVHMSESRSDRNIFKNIFFNISRNTKDLTVTPNPTDPATHRKEVQPESVGPERRYESILEYQAMPSLRARRSNNDGVLCTFSKRSAPDRGK
jgi:hypothetical protein